MAHDGERFTPWKTVYSHFSHWNKTGVWEKSLDKLNSQYRLSEKRAAPSYAIIDSQSVKTIYASEERGIDGGKKVKGRKRHIIVETLGNLLHVSVLPIRWIIERTFAWLGEFRRLVKDVEILTATPDA